VYTIATYSGVRSGTFGIVPDRCVMHYGPASNGTITLTVRAVTTVMEFR
jgi:hypothetical protein